MLKTTILANVSDVVYRYRTSEQFFRKTLASPSMRLLWRPVIVRNKPGTDAMVYYRKKGKIYRTNVRLPYAGVITDSVSPFKRGKVKLPSLSDPVKYTKPNPFVFHTERGKGAGYRGTGQWAKLYALGNRQGASNGWTCRDAAISIAMQRFVDLIRTFDKAGLGETFGEIGQTLDAIQNRSRQLTLSFQALKAGRFKESYRCLGLRADDFNRHPGTDTRVRAKHRAGDIGGAWLEYWFGWSPLVMTIDYSMKVLTGTTPLSRDKVVGWAKTRDAYRDVRKQGDHTIREVGDILCRVRVQSRVAVSSGPRVLASQLGLNNPIQTAWNLTRFSWLVDWFSNVSRFLDSWNWTDGFTFTDSFYTVSFEGSDSYFFNGETLVDEKFFRVERTLGLPSLSYKMLKPRLPRVLSPTRAATAVSLLLQSFASVHTDTTHYGAKHLK